MDDDDWKQSEWFYLSTKDPRLSPYTGSLNAWRKNAVVDLPGLVVLGAVNGIGMRVFIHRDLIGSLDKAKRWPAGTKK